MDQDNAIAILRELAQEWKMKAAIARQECSSFGEMAWVREDCAKQLLDKVFEIESQ